MSHRSPAEVHPLMHRYVKINWYTFQAMEFFTIQSFPRRDSVEKCEFSNPLILSAGELHIFLGAEEKSLVSVDGCQKFARRRFPCPVRYHDQKEKQHRGGRRGVVLGFGRVRRCESLGTDTLRGGGSRALKRAAGEF